jgi:hypothetical protein
LKKIMADIAAWGLRPRWPFQNLRDELARYREQRALLIARYREQRALLIWLGRRPHRMMSSLRSDGHDNGTLAEGWNVRR